MLDEGAEVAGYDPEAMGTTRETFGDQIEYGEGMYEVLEGAEALIICTEWHEFRRPDLGKVRDLLAKPIWRRWPRRWWNTTLRRRKRD